MTLIEALQVMQNAGYTQVLDEHSRFPRDIAAWFDEAKLDLNDYIPDPETGEIRQNHPTPSNYFICS